MFILTADTTKLAAGLKRAKEQIEQMPTSPPSLCARCRGTRPGTCKCSKRDDTRPNRHQRGYDYQWEQFAKRFKAEHPLCQDCLEEGRVAPAEETHHILKLADHPELKYEETNLRNLCKPCHSGRTAKGE